MPNPVITLPWPDSNLNPNARTHWSKKARAVKLARRSGMILAMQAGFNAGTFYGYEGMLHLWVKFYPKTRRRVDDDNALASIKAYRDGIADALSINDCRFISHPLMMEETGGKIEITITRGPHGFN